MNNIALFDYQKEMVMRVQEAFRTHQSVMVQMPTGTGKTYLLAAIVKSEERRVFESEETTFDDREDSHSNKHDKCLCIWIVAHRRELVAQIEETLARFGLPTSASGNSSLSTLHSSLIRVVSIQWLSRHYGELQEEPSLIVIDEAHHAVADTYAEVMRAYPKAKKLGLTATPYRLNGGGFTDLFDVLLTSWSVERFIANGRLSLYDYYSIKPNCQEQLMVDSLKKRGADGDYQLKEMSEVMDVRPSLERLCHTMKQYAAQKKGIVYAFSIAHAEHIAEVYRQQGISAVAISSQTPKEQRQELIARFKKTNMIADSSLPNNSSLFTLHSSLPKDSSLCTLHSSLPKDSSLCTLHSSLPIQVLVSVDLFSEGFDCPDVEFIQLARPTLSLSKYLQMVGRGLRMANGKQYCVILDNVGLYRRFGLPSDDRDWQMMFEGRQELMTKLQETCLRINSSYEIAEKLGADGGNMTKIVSHNSQFLRLGNGTELDICKTTDNNGNEIWKDERSGVCFSKRPQCFRLLGIDFCTDDGSKFYPRIGSKFIDNDSFINLKTIELQVGCGLNWKRRFIPFAEPCKVYLLKEKLGNVRLYADELDNYFAQANPGMALTPISSQEDMNDYCQRYSLNEKTELQTHKAHYRHGLLYPINDATAMKKDIIKKYDDNIWFVADDTHGESYWVDGITGMKHYNKPRPQKRGFVNILTDGDWVYLRNIPDLKTKPLRNWQIVADDNMCVVDNRYLFLKQEPRSWFKILRRTDDFSYFVVKKFLGDANTDNPDIIISQNSEGGLKMECNGVRYIPRY